VDLAQFGALIMHVTGDEAGGHDSASGAAPTSDVVRLCRTAGTELRSAEELIQKLRPLAGHDRPAPAAANSHGMIQSDESSVGRLELSLPATPRRSLLRWAACGVGLGLAVIALWSRWRPAPPPLPEGLPSAAAIESTKSVRVRTPGPEIGKPWTNSLAMPFMALGKAHLGVLKVRVRDFAAFVDASHYDAEGGMYSWQHDGFKEHGHSWRNPGFPQTMEHPVVGISWEDANKFCEWLTQKERGEGTLNSSQAYRLPTDREWDLAVGLPEDPGTVPEERSSKVKDVYPWGTVFPPDSNDRNYAGSESKVNVPDNWSTLLNYRDPYPRTRPATDLKPNAQGFCDLGGNAWEWCDDRYNARMSWRVLRGGSWATSRQEEMLSSYRQKYDPTFRHDDVGFRCIVANVGEKR
jgi:formylglycine-generating enzyme required for sulfatase activity